VVHLAGAATESGSIGFSEWNLVILLFFIKLESEFFVKICLALTYFIDAKRVYLLVEHIPTCVYML
jgi:hypothetical protein